MLFDLIGRLNRPFLSFADGAGGGDGGDGSGGGGGGGGGGGKDGDGGGGGGGDDAMKALVKKHEAELESVKNHRDLTIVEKRDMKAKLDELKTSFDKLGGQEGIDRLVTLKDTLEKDEVGKLLTAGKHDAWLDAKTKALRADHSNQIKAIQEKLDGANTRADGVTLELKRKKLETEVHTACGSHGVLPDAVSDVMLYADSVFSQSTEHNRMVIQDKDGGVVFGKDGKSPKSITEWLDEQKETKRHWFPPSKGADASGNLSGGERTADDIGDVKNVKDWREQRKKLGLGSGYGTDAI